jgi:hypothetical protein
LTRAVGPGRMEREGDMTEAEWDACADPTPMLEFLRRKATERRLRLFACACVRRIWHLLRDERSRRAVEVAEDYADGMAEPDEAYRAWRAATIIDRGDGLSDDGHANAVFWASDAACFAAGPEGIRAMSAADSAVQAITWATSRSAAVSWDDEETAQAALLRDIVGNPFRPRPPMEAAWLAWNDGAVRKLAQAVYGGRAFDRMPLLADALEDAGCADAAILGHCRGGGEHVRGCWVVDLVLGKE